MQHPSDKITRQVFELLLEHVPSCVNCTEEEFCDEAMKLLESATVKEE